MEVLRGSVKFPVLCLFFIAIAISCARIGPRAIRADITHKGTILDEDLAEVSGIAVSRIRDDTLWVINDSGNSASVYALDSKGERICTLNIQGVANNDWEDIASFEYEGNAYLLIADVGDNFARRSRCFLHFVEEPDLREARETPCLLSAKPSWSITYAYEDGPRDCESVAVDAAGGKILLLSKRDIPPVLYELPLTKEKNAVAEKCAVIGPLPRRAADNSRFWKNSNQPTAMDISADGLFAVVLTYSSAFRFTRKRSTDWTEAFMTPPKEIPIPALQQAESICLSRDGKDIYITSEQLPAPLIRFTLRYGGDPHE